MKEVDILRIRGDEEGKGQDQVVREYPLSIILNGERLVTLLCTPQDLKELALGYLLYEGFIVNFEDVKSLSLNQNERTIQIEVRGGEVVVQRAASLRVITSGCGGGISYQDLTEEVRAWKVTSQERISKGTVLRLMRELQRRSKLFRATGGVHSVALADGERILAFKEDIGRHNAVDKVFGECLLQGIPTHDKIVLLSGRLSSEIVLKVVKQEVPILVSRAAPTDAGVRLAQQVGITLVGFARSRRMNVYTHDWRIV